MMDLKHAAVVRVYDPRGEDDTFCYFVMELVPGGNLRDAVLGKLVEGPRLLPLIVEVGEALAEAHRRKLVHRDVKPQNILLDENGAVKLTDFDFDLDLVGAHDTTGGTRTGALGTIVYAAPECLDRPQHATAQADVFGLGMTAIFFEHVDWAERSLRLPDPKGGAERAFKIPLSKTCLDILRRRQTENAASPLLPAGDDGFAFSAINSAGEVGPISDLRQQVHDGNKHARFPAEDVHTLRRTSESVAHEVGITELDQHELTNRDPHWPLLAAQKLGRRALILPGKLGLGSGRLGAAPASACELTMLTS